MTLTEFLLAQIAEDEAVARAAVGTAAFQQQTGRWVFRRRVDDGHGHVPIVFALAVDGARTQVANLETAWEREERGAHIAHWDPARVLAECEVKRRIVELHQTDTVPGVGGALRPHCTECSSDEYPGPFPCLTLRLLALPCAEHPHFRPEWRP